MQNNFVIVSFGSNLGEREKNIHKAVSAIQSSDIMKDTVLSEIIETDAILLEGSPKSWNKKFLNAVMCGSTRLSPQMLLSRLKDVESYLGRSSSEKWSPRLIDIDILFYNNLYINEDEIQIPHPEFLNRKFLVELVSKITPDYTFPVRGRFYKEKMAAINKHLTVHEEV
ncbi:MAG: 2-amino-4-hydroxy-6-hydroxymethyldihydropteridine diphosphokinase [Rickettsiales bacterium]